MQAGPASVCGELVGPWATDALEDLASRASRSFRLLLTGEPGTGKRTLAMALHRRIHPAGGVRIESVAIGEPTATYQRLFGREGRSPDGSGLYWPGVVERAHGGTVLLSGLDRAGDDLVEAVHLWLESGRFVPSGGDDRRTEPVTLFASLDGELTASTARIAPLFDHVLRCKPLRERPVDAEEFVRARAACLPPAAVRHLASGPLPGNYPELERLAAEEVRIWREKCYAPGLTAAEIEKRMAAAWKPRESDAPELAPTQPARPQGQRTKKDILLELAKRPECAGMTIEQAAARARASTSYTKKILKQAGVDLPSLP